MAVERTGFVRVAVGNQKREVVLLAGEKLDAFLIDAARVDCLSHSVCAA